MSVWFEEELRAYESHKWELLARSRGKYVLIKGAEVVAPFDTEMDAVRQGFRQFGNTDFLVRQIVEFEPEPQFVCHAV